MLKLMPQAIHTCSLCTGILCRKVYCHIIHVFNFDLQVIQKKIHSLINAKLVPYLDKSVTTNLVISSACRSATVLSHIMYKLISDMYLVCPCK